MKFRMLMPAMLLLIPSAAPAQQAGQEDVLSTYLRRAYAAVARDISDAVKLMPEQELGMRPAGVVEEVRTFGEIVAHILEVNSWVCAMGDGKPNTTFDSGIAKQKTLLLTAIDETDARCTAYLATLTDAALTQTIRSGSGEMQLEAVRGNGVVFVIAHANEHYGNIVTYLRANGLVPPKAASQAIFLKRAGTP